MAGAVAESSAPTREVRRMQFGILSPDEIVSHSPVAVRRHRPSDRLGETLSYLPSVHLLEIHEINPIISLLSIKSCQSE